LNKVPISRKRNTSLVYLHVKYRSNSCYNNGVMSKNPNLDQYFYVLHRQSCSKCVGTHMLFWLKYLLQFSDKNRYEIMLTCVMKLEPFPSHKNFPPPHNQSWVLIWGREAKIEFQRWPWGRGGHFQYGA